MFFFFCNDCVIEYLGLVNQLRMYRSKNIFWIMGNLKILINVLPNICDDKSCKNEPLAVSLKKARKNRNICSLQTK